MDIHNAPEALNDGDEAETCSVCGLENSYVLYDNDKVCHNCGHAPDSRENRTSLVEAEPWRSWWKHRDNEYDGFYGPDRIKMVGGFKSQYP